MKLAYFFMAVICVGTIDCANWNYQAKHSNRAAYMHAADVGTTAWALSEGLVAAGETIIGAVALPMLPSKLGLTYIALLMLSEEEQHKGSTHMSTLTGTGVVSNVLIIITECNPIGLAGGVLTGLYLYGCHNGILPDAVLQRRRWL